jgi:hypothetical protein
MELEALKAIQVRFYQFFLPVAVAAITWRGHRPAQVVDLVLAVGMVVLAAQEMRAHTLRQKARMAADLILSLIMAVAVAVGRVLLAVMRRVVLLGPVARVLVHLLVDRLLHMPVVVVVVVTAHWPPAVVALAAAEVVQELMGLPELAEQSTLAEVGAVVTGNILAES